MHGEELAIAQRRQGDVHRHPVRQLRDRVRLGSDIVDVIVDGEVPVVPQRAPRVRRRDRLDRPAALVTLDVGKSAGPEEVTAGRLGIRSRLEADHAADRVAVEAGRALGGQEPVVGVDGVDHRLGDGQAQRGLIGSLLVGLELVEVRATAVRRPRLGGVRRRRLRQHPVALAAGGREDAAARDAPRIALREVEGGRPEVEALLQHATHLGRARHLDVARGLLAARVKDQKRMGRLSWPRADATPAHTSRAASAVATSAAVVAASFPLRSRTAAPFVSPSNTSVLPISARPTPVPRPDAGERGCVPAREQAHASKTQRQTRARRAVIRTGSSRAWGPARRG